MALEPASELSSGERGNAEVVEAEMVDFINDYANDEDEVTFDITPSKKRRFGIGRVKKGGNFNEALGKN